MNQERMNALMSAGEAGGAYLDSIEQCDLGLLTSDQFITFLDTVVCVYDDARSEDERNLMKAADAGARRLSDAEKDILSSCLKYVASKVELGEISMLEVIPF